MSCVGKLYKMHLNITTLKTASCLGCYNTC